MKVTIFAICGTELLKVTDDKVFDKEEEQQIKKLLAYELGYKPEEIEIKYEEYRAD